MQTLNKHIFLPPEDTVEQRSVQVLAIFSSPHRWPNGVRITPLRLMRELQHLQKNIKRKQVLPAARFPQDVEASLKGYYPRIVQFSGHGFHKEFGEVRWQPAVSSLCAAQAVSELISCMAPRTVRCAVRDACV